IILKYNLTLLLLFNPVATPLDYTHSLHDALPIYFCTKCGTPLVDVRCPKCDPKPDTSPKGDKKENGEDTEVHPVHENYIQAILKDRKSTRLNSSHVSISYAVFCLKKKNYRTTPES